MTQHPDRTRAAGLLVRPIDQGHLPEIRQHLLALGATDRHRRFGRTLNDAAITAYVLGMDHSRALLVGAFCPSGRVVGLAEAQPTGVPFRMEMAVSVQPPFRRLGLGRALVLSAAAAAFARGADVVEFLFAPGNHPITALVRAIGAQVAMTLDQAEMRPR